MLQRAASPEHKDVNASRDIISRVIKYITSDKESRRDLSQDIQEVQRSFLEKSAKLGVELKDSFERFGQINRQTPRLRSSRG